MDFGAAYVGLRDSGDQPFELGIRNVVLIKLNRAGAGIKAILPCMKLVLARTHVLPEYHNAG